MTPREAEGGNAIERGRVVEPGEGLEQSRWTFTLDRWTPRSKLRIEGETAVIQDAWPVEKQKGYLTSLRAALEEDGFEVTVETPGEEMMKVLEKWKYERHDRWYKPDPGFDGPDAPVESWRQPATRRA